MSDRAEDNLNYRSNKEAKKVGKFTGNYTQTGRKIYKTDTGELVSEQSFSIPFEADGIVINVPSIHSGKVYTEKSLKDMLKLGKIKPTSIHKTMKEAREAAKKRSKLLKPKDN